MDDNELSQYPSLKAKTAIKEMVRAIAMVKKLLAES